MNDYFLDRSAKTASGVLTPREIIFRYLPYLPWIVIAVAVTLILAYLELRYAPVIFKVSGKLLVSPSNMGGRGQEKFDDIFMMQGNNNKINDEIEVIRSRNTAARVISSLGLQLTVSNKGNVKASLIHPKAVPFEFVIDTLQNPNNPFVLEIKIFSDYFQLNEASEKYAYGQIVRVGGLSFHVGVPRTDLSSYSSNIFIINWSPLENMAASLSKSISVGLANDISNVIAISYETENIPLGVDVVNAFMAEYQKANLEDKRQTAAQTLDFIVRQLDTVKVNLGRSEMNLQSFREQQQIFDPEKQATISFEGLTDARKELIAEQYQIKVVDYLINYLSNEQNSYKLVPSMLGIQEPTLAEQVVEFNRLQLERESMLKTTPRGNPTVLAAETSIEKLRTAMIESLRNIRQTHVLATQQLQTKTEETGRSLSMIPSKEKQLKDVTRQQSILQELFAFLLQKQLETSIASASTISNIKVLESGMSTGGPVSPNRRATFLIALLVGLGVPVGIIVIRERLNDKIKNKLEIQQITDTPILGEIGHAADSKTLIVTKNSRKFLAEQFRIIRSNLQYILPKVEKLVIMVTSSFSGEGKSFISTNMGAVLALSGRKTVILEFDIRKPKIMEGLGMTERRGITNYVIGAASIDEIIYPVPGTDGLFVVPCGPVPPNPSEMLLSERINELFRELRNRFDAVIIDTAPVGLVSDGITLGQNADAVIYIVRHNYTLKKQIHLVDDLYKNKKLPGMSIIVNDVSISGGGYGGYYGYGGHYGYGYGYGYASSNVSSDYFEQEQGTKSRKRRKWFRWFK